MWRDLARLSVHLIMDGYPLPMSLRQVQLMCTAQWVELSDISRLDVSSTQQESLARWLDVPASVAYLVQRPVTKRLNIS